MAFLWLRKLTVQRTKNSCLEYRSQREASRRRTRRLITEGLEERRVLDASYFDLSGGNFTQDWSNAGLITANDDWSGVPSVVGFLGQNLTTATGVDATTVTGTSTIANDIDVIANQSNPNTLTSGGVAEFEIANPVVAIQGSGTADAPYLQFHLNTTGRTTVRFQANLRDVDGSGDNAIQQINVQYRVGTTEDWSNVSGGYFADVTTGPSSATAETTLDVTLPSAAENQAQVQVRVITTNAAGSDEWVGIDDIVISSTPSGGDTTPPTVVSIDDGDADDTVVAGEVLTYVITFSEDIDSATVTAADFDNDGTSAITIGNITETSNGVFSVEVTPTTAGTLRLRIPTGSVIQDVAGNALAVPVSDDTEVTVTAGDITPPTVTSIADDDADDIIPVGATVTYAVTFSEDIDESTVSPSDFDNAGTSTISIGTVTETLAGVFTVPVTATTAGTLQLRISGSILDLAGNALVVAPPILDAETITVDGTAPTLTSITDSISGGPGFVNSPITYTVTFNEDIDAATVTAADFDNAGTATISVGAISETSPGTFSVVVTPSSTGTVQLRIPNSAVISDVVGNNLVVPQSDDTVITINAITSLAVGDISIIGYRADAADGLAFVTWVDLLPGTSINFWDSGYIGGGDGTGQGAGGGTWRASENFATWSNSTGSTVVAGTVIVLSFPNLVGRTADLGSVEGALDGLAAGGDQIFAGQGQFNPGTNPSTFEGSLIFGFDFSGNNTTWDASAVDSATSALPSVLNVANGNLAVMHIDNGQYTASREFESFAAARTSALNAENWSFEDDGLNVFGALDSTDFTLITDTTPPTVTSIDDGDADDTVLVNDSLTYTITFSEDINDSTVNATDFDNAGTSAITIGAITETSPGVFTVVVTPTSVGTLQLRIKSDADIQDPAGNALAGAVTDDTTVTVSSSDTTPPTVTSIDDGDADNLVANGAVLTYVISFSEDIDELTVSSADFDNAGTASITIGAITETSAGVFTVVVTATSGGTLQLRIPSTADIRDLANNALSVPVLDDDTLTVDATAPTLVSITDDVSGGPVLTGSTIVYTVTFSEDIDAASVTAADFSNAGTATITVGAISESSAGVFSVTILTTSSGTVILQIPTGSVISDLVGNELVVPQQDDTTIQVNDSTLATGDIAFVGYNADGNDDFAFVALVNITGGERIVFTDNEWSGTAFNTGEGEIIWTAPAGGVVAGTVIQINSVSSAATITATVGTVTGTFNIGASDEAIFAITGSQPAPTAFLTAISNDGAAGFTSLANTGLVLGVNAIDFTTVDIDADVMAYTGTRTARGTFAAYRRLINDPTNWVTQDAGGDQDNDGTAPDVPFDNTAFTLATQSSILLISEVVFDPEGTVDTGEEYIELRGTPNTIVPEDAFLVLLDGDSEDGAGNVDHIFDIRGMAFGSNGYLVLRQFGSTYAVDSAASVFTATTDGWGASWSSRSTDIENGSVSVLLIQSSLNPVSDTDVDANNDGTLDGDGAAWTIRDAIGNIDGGASDTGYGFLNTSGNGNGSVPAGSTFVNLSGYHPDYMARNGESTGHALLDTSTTDWVIGELSGTMPTISLATGAFALPSAFVGAAIDDLGALNTFSVSLADPVLTVTAPNAVYTAAAYAGASVDITGANAPIPTVTFTYYVGTGTSGTNLGSAAPIDVGTYTVVASTPANSANNAAASSPVTFDITPAQLTATATAANKIYDGNTAASVTITLQGVLASDAVAGSAAGTFENKNAATGKVVTVGTITLSGVDATNYTVSAAPDTTANIIAKVIGATGSALDKVYDGTTTASVTVSLTGVIDPDDVSATAAGNFESADVGINKAVILSNVSLSGADSGNYSIGTTINPTADITAKDLTVSADAKSKVYGDADPALTFTANGLVVGDTLTGSLSRITGENVGIYAIQQGTISAGSNYTVTYVGADLTITQKSLTITADAKSKVVGQVDPPLTYTVDGLVSSDTVSGALTRLSGEAAGEYAIQQGTVAVDGAAGANYAVNFVGANLTITAAPPVVTSVVVNGADSFPINGNQRSVITSLVVSFDTAVELAAGALTLVNIDNSTVVANLIITPNGASNQFTVRFGTGAGVLGRSGAGSQGNSLIDGNYRLQIDAAKVTASGTAMAADYFFGNSFNENFFALFGDSDGDGDVDGTDTIALRRHARGLEYNAAFDYDGDGVTGNDLDDVNAYNANRNKTRKPFPS